MTRIEKIVRSMSTDYLLYRMPDYEETENALRMDCSECVYKETCEWNVHYGEGLDIEIDFNKCGEAYRKWLLTEVE